MTRRAFTLVEALVVVAILLTLAGLLWPAVSLVMANAGRQENAGEAAVRQPPGSWELRTEQHDGHWWVTYISSQAAAFRHHPDCPCMSRKAESEEK